MAERSIFNEPDVDFHLKLNQQLFHIPYELLSKRIKHTQAVINKETKSLHEHLSLIHIFLKTMAPLCEPLPS